MKKVFVFYISMFKLILMWSQMFGPQSKSGLNVCSNSEALENDIARNDKTIGTGDSLPQN